MQIPDCNSPFGACKTATLLVIPTTKMNILRNFLDQYFQLWLELLVREFTLIVNSKAMLAFFHILHFLQGIQTIEYHTLVQCIFDLWLSNPFCWCLDFVIYITRPIFYSVFIVFYFLETDVLCFTIMGDDIKDYYVSKG